MKVLCQICKKEFDQITTSHLRSHNMTMSEYKNKFPDSPIISDSAKKKRDQTKIERYGSKNPYDNQEFKLQAEQKRKQTNKKKYGYENCYDNLDFKKHYNEQCKRTNLEKYGVEHHMQNPDILEKRNNTNIEKYGYEYPIQNEKIKQKLEKTCEERYGTKSVLESKEIKNQIKNTNLKKYDNEYAIASKEIKQKIKKSLIKKYGVSNPMQDSKIKNKSIETKRCIKENEIVTLLQNTEYRLKEGYTKAKETHIVVHKNCGNEFEFVFHNGKNTMPVCKKCYPNSKGEQELFDYVKRWCSDAEQSNKSILNGKELDIWIPSKSIAFEFCGLYWHGERSRPDKKYHYEKWKNCKEQGIHLITMWDSEWNLRNEKVKSRIDNLLGNREKICGARSCEINHIVTGQAKEFCNKYHLHGYQQTKIKLGAFYNDQLVAVMTFGKRKITGTKEPSWEIIRFCSQGNIPGIASRLFKRFINEFQPEHVLSFSDNRWDTGNLYKKLGFKQMNQPEPGYAYTKDYCTLEHRYNYTKQSLVNNGHDPNLTEWQIMQSLGYDRIWDCGMTRWEWFKN